MITARFWPGWRCGGRKKPGGACPGLGPCCAAGGVGPTRSERHSRLLTTCVLWLRLRGVKPPAVRAAAGRRNERVAATQGCDRGEKRGANTHAGAGACRGMTADKRGER